MAELGDTQDPRQLVPGRPEAIDENVRVLRARGDRANQAGEGLLAIDTGAWQGPAAREFQDKFSYEPSKWLDAADSLSGAADVLTQYADTLRWGQSQAVEAIDLWNQGQSATQQARAAHDTAVAQAAANNQPAPAFTDPGESSRQAARDTLSRARSQLNEAGDSIAGFLRDYAAEAPQNSNWLDDVGNFLSDVGTHIVNDVASFGNALLHHPEDVLGALGGLGLTVASGAGMVGGAVLTATGEGAVVGVPVMGVSAAGAVTGAGMMTAAVGDLAAHAGGDDRVEVVKPRHESSKPTKTDRLKEHLTDKDLDGARRELNGEVVKEKASGVPWDHVDEVRNAQRGLVKQINRLKQQLSDSRLAPEDRPALEAELSDASRLLDYSEQFVPRGLRAGSLVKIDMTKGRQALPEQDVRDELSVEQVEDDYWGDSPPDSTYLIRTIHEVRRKPIGLLSPEDMRIMLGQQVGVDILVPRALARLEENPLLEGDFYPGDVLVSVVHLPDSYWRKHPEELTRTKRIIETVRKLDDPDAQDDDLNRDIDEFLRRVKA